MKKFLNGLNSFLLMNSKMNSNGLLDNSLLALKANSTVYSVSGGQDSILNVILLLHLFSVSIFQRNFDNFGCDSLPKFLTHWNTFVGYRNSTFLVEDHFSSVGLVPFLVQKRQTNCAQLGGSELEKSFAIKNKLKKKRAKKNDNFRYIVYCQHFWQSKNFFCSEVLFELSWLGELSYTLILAQTSVQSENKARVWRKKTLIRFSQLQKIFSVGLGQTKSDFIEKTINNIFRGTSPKSFSKSSDLSFHYSTNSFFTSSIVKPQIRLSIENLFAGNTAQDFLFWTHAPKNFQFLKKDDFLKHVSSTFTVFKTTKQQNTLTISKSWTESMLVENFEKILEKGSKKEKQRNNTRKNRLRLASYGAGPKFCKNFGNGLKKGKEFISKNPIFELPRKKTFEKSSKNWLKTRRLIKQLYSKPTELNLFISHNCCCFPLKIITKLTLLRVVKTEDCCKREFISFLVSRKKKSNNFVVMEFFSLSFCLTQKIVQKTRTQQTPTNFLTRLQVSKFIKFYDLPVLHDITNFSTIFSRNKLRHVFIPFTRLIFAPQFENVYSNFSYLVGQDHQQIQIEISKFKKIFNLSSSNRRIGLLICQECKVSQFLKQSVIQTFISEYKELEISFRDLNKVINFLAHI